MKIQENILLSLHTTFRIGGPARYFCEVNSEEDLIQVVGFSKENGLRILVIGGGSNLLVSDTGFKGLVIKIGIKGLEFVDDSESVLVNAGAGENWEGFVAEAVSRGLYGVENLSSIPGTVGASPVQNIGAYGAEASQIIESVRAYDLAAGKFLTLKNDECRFSYRDSIFKQEKGRYIVTGVTFKLRKNGKTDLSYKELKTYFSNDKNPGLNEVRNAVIEIRKNKLPDWRCWGTAGSFFKNPVIASERFFELKRKYPELPGYREEDGRYKVSLGWILDKICGAKGLTIGNVGTYENQALVLVAKPGAKAEEIVNLANHLMVQVKEKTGIDIEGEVEWSVV